MAIIGAVLGDIAGSQYEFTRMRPKDLDWKNCELFTKKCRFTDDTVLTIGTKKAILEDKENPNFGLWYQKMGISHPNAGYGGMFREYLQDPDRTPYYSFGNGSAMRVSPIVDLYNDYREIIEVAKLSAVCTHNHPEGAKGAIVTAACAKIAKETKSKQSIYEFAQKFYGNSGFDFNCSGSSSIVSCFVAYLSGSGCYCFGLFYLSVRLFQEQEVPLN